MVTGRLLVAIALLSVVSYAQTTEEPIVLVGTREPSPAGTIVISPAEREDFLRVPKPAPDLDLSNWIAKQSALFGLSGAPPFHAVIVYDQFDEDGDNIHSGVLDEYWVSDQKFKRTYRADNLNQTDFATAQGLFREGDQRWPNEAETEVRSEVLDPFYSARSEVDIAANSEPYNAGGTELQCVALRSQQPGTPVLSDPEKYCFLSGSSDLRYVRGKFWHQTTYNSIVSFAGRRLAQEVAVTNAGKPYLKLTLQTIEPLTGMRDADFAPPPSAQKLSANDRVSGVRLTVVKLASPKWPDSFRGRHAKVAVAIVVGKDGRVKEAHASDGPRDAYAACERAARESVFVPFRILGKPVEVTYTLQFQIN